MEALMKALFHNSRMSSPSTATRTALEYFLVDVFTSEPFAGNTLAVVFDTIGLTTETMQTIAREFNLSETTFIQRRAAEIEAQEGIRVRIFTTQEELPFAGHPTLGTSSVLKLHAPETVRDNAISLALNVGKVPVVFSELSLDPATDNVGRADAVFGEMTQRDPEFASELDPAEIAPLLGLSLADLDSSHAPQVVSTGNGFAIVLLRSLDSLARLKVDCNAATPWLRQRRARWFYAIAPNGVSTGSSPEKYRARMQFEGGEDPATGSAAGCAIAYLVARSIVPSGARIHVSQGIDINRPSDLFLSAKIDGLRVTDVRVAGSTVPVANGRIFLP